METIVRRLKLLGYVPNQHSYFTFDFIYVFGAVVVWINLIRPLTGVRERAKLSTGSIWVPVRLVGFHPSTVMYALTCSRHPLYAAVGSPVFKNPQQLLA